MSDSHLTVLVSSTVHGQEELLDQVFAVLTGFGFRVWMSHKGTLPLVPGRSSFENCLAAVESCDIFLGIITGRYGSGRSDGEPSITHREILHSIGLNKPRFFAVQRDVVIAREILKQFRFRADGKPRVHTFYKKTAVLDDVRVIDMYEAAIRSDIPLSERTDNWVQQFNGRDDLLLFLRSQFADPDRLKKLLANLEGPRDE